jgi:hypothetical protein
MLQLIKKVKLELSKKTACPFVLIVRMINIFFRINGSNELDLPKTPLNYLLKKIFGMEKILLRYVNLPYGVSLLAVVKKN